METLDLSNVTSGFEPIPAGEYLVRCEDLKVDSKSDDKSFLLAQFKVMGGDYEGRIIFERFTTKHPNPKAVNVGLGKLKRFLQASGYPTPDKANLMEITGLQALAAVKVEQSEGYDPKNVISSFKKIPTTTVKDPLPF